MSIIRSLLDCLRALIPGLPVGKILIQRDEETVQPKIIVSLWKMLCDISFSQVIFNIYLLNITFVKIATVVYI